MGKYEKMVEVKKKTRNVRKKGERRKRVEKRKWS